MKRNFWYVIAGIAVIAVIAIIARTKRDGEKTEVTPAKTNTEQTAAQKQPTGSFWEGTLQESNNPKKGNLMLLSGKTTIYIHTSRDFTDLIGKQVQVTYQGTTESFELGDITAK